MNSLSSFENHANPLTAFLNHVSGYAKIVSSISIIQNDDKTIIVLPKKTCIIEISKNLIKIERANFDYDGKSKYQFHSINEAKDFISVLSGVCFEYGCTRAEADQTTYLVLKFLNEHTFAKELV